MLDADELRDYLAGDASFAFLMDILLSWIDILDCLEAGSTEFERRALDEDALDLFTFLAGEDLKVTFLVPNKFTLIEDYDDLCD